MPCCICLDAYDAEHRPAAVPCGHIFHEACIRDWIASRTHGAPPGCPLCKAPTDASAITPLWPSDASDFNLYVARHIAGGDDMLAAACEFVFAMQSFVMAAHGVRASALTRSRGAAERAIDAVMPEQAGAELRAGMQHLADVVHHAETLTRRLAAQCADAEHRAAALDAAAADLDVAKRTVDARAASIERHAQKLKHRQKQVLAAHEHAKELAASLDARERELDREAAAVHARAQDTLASAKAASMEEIRRAALREAQAAERESAALARAREADERASDADAALAEIRAKNARMADQMRELQAAVREQREKRRAERQRDEQPKRRREHVPEPRAQENVPLDDDGFYPMPGFGARASPLQTKNRYTIHVPRGA